MKDTQFLQLRQRNWFRFAQTSKYVVLVFPDFVEKERYGYASQRLTEKEEEYVGKQNEITSLLSVSLLRRSRVPLNNQEKQTSLGSFLMSRRRVRDGGRGEAGVLHQIYMFV